MLIPIKSKPSTTNIATETKLINIEMDRQTEMVELGKFQNLWVSPEMLPKYSHIK